jgi:hypothetical protein
MASTALGVGHVAHMGGDLAAAVAHARDGLAHRLGIAVDRENPGAFPGEDHRGGAAIAPARSDAAGAGDQRHLALQPFLHGQFTLMPAS